MSSSNESGGAAGGNNEAAAATKFVDEAGNYLSEYNFRTLMEWLTAEALFEMPEDPLSFICAVTKDRLQQRQGENYQASDADNYLHDCYDIQTSGGKKEERNARIRAIQAELFQEPSTQAKSGQDGNDKTASDRLILLEEVINDNPIYDMMYVSVDQASRTIATELDPMDATQNIIKETTKLLQADRATLFKLDQDGEELKLMVAEGAKSIRVPVGQGISGTVAATGKLENIPNAYDDDRFDSTNDKKTGYETKSILAAPVRDASDNIVGVIQAINCKKEGGVFTDIDEEVIGILAAQAGIALRNADLFAETKRSQKKVRAMVEVVKSVNSDLGTNSLMFTIGQKTPALIDAQRCTFYLANHATNELWAVEGDHNFKIPIDQGIAGLVVTQKKILNIPDAYDHPQFNDSFDKQTGFRTRQMLCVPLFGSEQSDESSSSQDSRSVIAVLQLINKEGTKSSFTEEDEQLVLLFSKLVAPIIEKSQLFQQQNRKGKQDSNELGSDFTKPGNGRTIRDQSSAPATIEEGEEEGDGEVEDDKEAAS